MELIDKNDVIAEIARLEKISGDGIDTGVMYEEIKNSIRNMESVTVEDDIYVLKRKAAELDRVKELARRMKAGESVKAPAGSSVYDVLFPGLRSGERS